MELGIHYANFTLPGGAERAAPTLADTARAAEESGVARLHPHGPLLPDGAPRRRRPSRCSRATRRLGFLAGQTERIELGLLVTGVTYRHPGLLAKIVTTLDVLSGGRAMLGIGAAWYEREHLGLGVPYPSIERAVRAARGDAADRASRCGATTTAPTTGKHYQLAETICVPPPMQPPRPPIMIGGSGERKTLRLVAQYADACNLFAPDADEVAPQARRARRPLRDRRPRPGRDREDDHRDRPTRSTDVDAFLRAMEGYAALGIEKVMLVPGTDDPPGSCVTSGSACCRGCASCRLPPVIRLYHRPKAGRPVRAAWTLEEAGAPFEIVRLSMDETRAAEHLERHPLGRVPVLEDDDGVLYESAAVCMHIADLVPEAGSSRRRDRGSARSSTSGCCSR